MERERGFLTGWRLDAAREQHAFQLANLVAAEAVQRPAMLRRLAILDALQSADRPLLAAELIARVEARLGRGAWGLSPRRTLHDEIRQLKTAGAVIRYRRGPKRGYVWESAHGMVDPEALRRQIDLADPAAIEEAARLSPREKLERAEAMAPGGKHIGSGEGRLEHERNGDR
jgi:hypothetical protein